MIFQRRLRSDYIGRASARCHKESSRKIAKMEHNQISGCFPAIMRHRDDTVPFLFCSPQIAHPPAGNSRSGMRTRPAKSSKRQIRLNHLQRIYGVLCAIFKWFRSRLPKYSRRLLLFSRLWRESQRSRFTRNINYFPCSIPFHSGPLHSCPWQPFHQIQLW